MATLAQYRNMLRINKHRLDDELELQAQVQDEIAGVVAKANSRVLELKDSLVRVEAELFTEVKEADPKLSNPMAEAQAKRMRGRQTAWSAYHTARQDFEEWSGLYEAWRQRGYSLKGLGDLYGHQYFAIDAVTGEALRRGEPDHAARAALRNAQAFGKMATDAEDAFGGTASVTRRRIT